jgi:large repetitive protein
VALRRPLQTATGAPLVTGAPLQITTPPALPNATVGQDYHVQLTATGGTAPMFWNIIDRQNSGGLQLDSGTGLLTGAANVMVQGPDLRFTITATDSSNPSQSVQQVVTLHTGP